jgi:hypothetical protein
MAEAAPDRGPVEPLEMEAGGAPRPAPAARQQSTLAKLITSSHSPGDDDDDLAQEVKPPAQGSGRRNSASEVLAQVGRKTLLSPEVVQELESNEPETLSWLQSASGLLLQVAMLAFYVMIDTAKGLSSKWAMETGKVQASALVLLNQFASILIGFGMIVKFEGLEKAKAAAVDIEAIKRFAFVAMLFTASTILNIMAYGTALDAGTVKILGQFRLVLSALMSRFILGRNYTFNHWMMLLIITITALAFYMGTEQRDEATKAHLKSMTPEECFMDYDPRIAKATGAKCIIVDDDGTVLGTSQQGSKTLGIMYLGAWILTIVSASLITEKFLKASGKTPFYIQKMQLEMSGVWVSIFSAFFVPAVVQGGAWDPLAAKRLWWSSTELTCEGKEDKITVGGNGLFEGFYGRAFVQLGCAILQGWLGGIIVKRFSTVVKNIAKSLSLILTVFSNEILFWECHDEPLSSTMYLLSISIFCSTVVFSQLGEDGAKPQAKPELAVPAGPGAPAVPLPAVSASEHQRKKSNFGPGRSSSGSVVGPLPGQGGAGAAVEDPAEEAMNEMIASQGQSAGGAGLSRSDTMNTNYQSGILKKGQSKQFR